MATVANIFSLKLDNKDFNNQLQQATRASQQYNSQIANSILETARLEEKRASLYAQRAKAQTEGSKERIREINREILATSSLIQSENKKISAIKNANTYLEQNIALMRKQTSAVRDSTLAQGDLEKRATRFRLDMAAQKTAETESIQRLRQQYAATYENTSAQNKFNESKVRLNAMLQSGAINQRQYNSALEKEKKILIESVPLRDSQFNQMIRMLRWGGTLVATFYAVNQAWGATIGRGIELGRIVEDNTYGIAALVAANTQMITSTGTAISVSEKFAMAQSISAKTLNDLRVASVKTFATFPQLTEIFQQAIGQTLSMGKSFGSTTEEVIQNTIQLSQRMSNIAGSIGMPMDRVREEIRSILSGNASTDSLISTLIFGSPAAANEAIRTAKAKGANAVQDLLNNMLKPYDQLQNIDTYTRSMLNFQNQYDSIVLKMAAPIKNDFKRIMDSLTASLDNNTIDTLSKDFESLYNTLKLVVTYGTEVAIAFGASKFATPIVTSLGRTSFALAEFTLATARSEAATFSLKRSLVVARQGLRLLGAELKATAVAFLPTAALMVGYELYNALIAKNIEYENKLHDVMATHQEDLSKLTQAQKAYSVEVLNRAYIEQTVKAREAHKKWVEEGTNQTRAMYDKELKYLKEIIAQRETYQKSMLASASTLQALQKSNGNLIVGNVDMKLVAQATKDVATARGKTIAGLETEKGKYKDVIKSIDEEIAKLKQAKGLDAERTDMILAREENRKQVLQKVALIQKEINDLIEKEALKRDAISAKLLQADLKRQNVQLQRGVESSSFERVFGTGKISADTAATAIANVKTTASEYKFSSATGKANAAKIVEDQILRIQKMIADIPNIELQIKLKGFDEFSSAIAGTANSFQDLMKFSQNYETTLTEINSRLKDQNLDTKTRTNLESKKIALQKQYTYTTLGGYADMSNAIAGFYSEDDDRKKKQLEVSKALQATQMALQIASLVQTTAIEGTKQSIFGTTALVAALGAPPPTNFIAYAAVAAMLASLGIMVGVGGGSATNSYDTIASQKENTGTGTVLGDSSAQSKSISSSLEILREYAKPQYQVLSNMDKNLSFMAQNIGGLAKQIIRSGGAMTGEGFTASAVPGLASSAYASSIGKINSEFTKLIAQLDTTLGTNGILSSVSGIISTLSLNFGGNLFDSIGGLIGSVFGGGKSKSLEDYGIVFNAQLLEAAMKSISGSAYQVIKTHTEGGLFGSDSNSYDTMLSTLDAQVRRDFGVIFSNMYDTIVQSGDALGKSEDDIASQLRKTVVSLGKISFKGKTGEQLQSQLEAVFGKAYDRLVATIYPRMVEFEKVGESLGETLARVVTGIQESDFYISKLGGTFQKISYLDVINKRGDVGLEALRQSILAFESTVHTTDTGVANIIASLGGSAQELYTVYTTLETIRVQLEVIGKSSSSYLTAAMVTGAGSVDALQSGLMSFIDNFLTVQEQAAYKTSLLKAQFDKLGLTLPATTQDFKNLVQGIDLTTSTGQELYGRVVSLSNGFKDMTDAIATSTQAVQSFMSSLFNTVKTASQSLQDTIDSLSQSSVLGGDSLTMYKLKFNAITEEIRSFTDASGNILPQYESQFSAKVSDLESVSKNILSTQMLSDQEKANLTTSIAQELGAVKNFADITKQTLSVYVVNDSIAITGANPTSLVGYLETQGATPLPSYDVGSPYIPYDQTALIHRGEMVIDRNSANALRKYGVEVSGGSSVDYTSIFNNIFGILTRMEVHLQKTSDATEHTAYAG